MFKIFFLLSSSVVQEDRYHVTKYLLMNYWTIYDSPRVKIIEESTKQNFSLTNRIVPFEGFKPINGRKTTMKHRFILIYHRTLKYQDMKPSTNHITAFETFNQSTRV